jgi:alpha-L-fucosidase
VDIASKGGNYLLNVGPTSEGLIPQPSVERLKEVGKWMKVNHEAIYATTASPFKKLPWGRATKKLSAHGATLYLHVFSWPADGKLLVPGLKTQPDKAWLLADKTPVSFTCSGDGVTLSVPVNAPDPISSTVVLKLKSVKIEIEQPVIAQSADGLIVLPATEARTHGDQLRYESGEHRDSLGFWVNPADWADWEFSVSKPGKFELSAEIASMGRSALEIKVGSQKARGETPATGDYGKFERVKLGTLEIKSSGKATLALHAVQEGWSPVNVKSLRLQPMN